MNQFCRSFGNFTPHFFTPSASALSRHFPRPPICRATHSVCLPCEPYDSSALSPAGCHCEGLPSLSTVSRSAQATGSLAKKYDGSVALYKTPICGCQTLTSHLCISSDDLLRATFYSRADILKSFWCIQHFHLNFLSRPSRSIRQRVKLLLPLLRRSPASSRRTF